MGTSYVAKKTTEIHKKQIFWYERCGIYSCQLFVASQDQNAVYIKLQQTYSKGKGKGKGKTKGKGKGTGKRGKRERALSDSKTLSKSDWATRNPSLAASQHGSISWWNVRSAFVILRLFWSWETWSIIVLYIYMLVRGSRKCNSRTGNKGII